MSINNSIQGCLEQLVEAFEKLQSELEEKHFGKVMENQSDFDQVSDEAKDQLDDDFRNVMVSVFENIEAGDHIEMLDLEAISHILLGTLEIVAPSVEAEEAEETEETE